MEMMDTSAQSLLAPSGLAFAFFAFGIGVLSGTNLGSVSVSESRTKGFHGHLAESQLGGLRRLGRGEGAGCAAGATLAGLELLDSRCGSEVVGGRACGAEAAAAATKVRWEESSSSPALSANNFVVGTFLRTGWEDIGWSEKKTTHVFKRGYDSTNPVEKSDHH